MSIDKCKYSISDACILCENCKNNCPKKAISLNENDFKYSIDAQLCINCGLCYRNCVYRAISVKNLNK